MDNKLLPRETIDAEIVVSDNAENGKQKTGFIQKLKEMKPSGFEDPNQKKAFANIIRFFALVLVLTIIAKGTAGATMARVETCNTAQGQVVEKTSVSGTVGAGATHGVETPEGLTIKNIPVTVGQKVEKGEPVVQFDPEELADVLEKEKTQLEALQTQLKQLSIQNAIDPTDVAGAQTAANRARQDQNSISGQNASMVSSAETDVTNADKKLEKAVDHLKNLPKDATKEARAAAKQEVEKCRTELEQAKSNLEKARSEAEQNRIKADRDVEDADRALESSKIRDSNARKDAAAQAADNSIKAAETRLSINTQIKKIAKLEKIGKDGTLASDADGTVMQTAQQGAKTDGTPAISLSDTSQGYRAEANLTKEEAEKLTTGMDVEVMPKNYYDLPLSGKLISLSEPDDAGMVKAIIKLEGDNWKQGQNVDINIIHSKKDAMETIPVSALKQDRDGYFVLGINQKTGVLGTENIAQKIPVTVSAKDNSIAAVEGIPYGTNIIKTSTKQVSAGDKVRVAE